MKNLNEFLKPVIWTLCIIFGLWGVEKMLNIDMSRITKIGPEGIEFETQTSIGELEQKIELLKIQVDILAEPGSLAPIDLAKKKEENIVFNTEKLQTVSDNIAQLSYVDRDNKRTKFYRQQGYIWIGDYESSTSVWEKVQLRTIKSKELITIPPEKIRKNFRFEVTSNIVLREEKPVNNIKYLMTLDRKGIIPSGTEVTIMEEPTKIEIGSTSQYWVKVKVEK